MADFAFNPPLTAPEKKMIKGKLEVRANKHTKMGLSDKHVPEGSIGYITGAGLSSHTSGPTVFWPSILKEHKGDWRTAVHNREDLDPTGKRG